MHITHTSYGPYKRTRREREKKKHFTFTWFELCLLKIYNLITQNEMINTNKKYKIKKVKEHLI